MKLSDRIDNVYPSATLQINELVFELKKANKKVFNLGLGEPDYPAPEIVTEGLHEVEQKGFTRYAEVAGTPELRNAIVQALSTCFHKAPSKDSETNSCGNELNYNSNQIIVSTGSKHLLYSTILALCNPKDEVILQAPYWVSYPSMVSLADAKPIVVKATVDEDFIPPAESIERAITDRTRLVFLNSPNNPTGQMWDNKQLKELLDVIIPHKNLYLLSDEIYGLISFDNFKHFSPAVFSEEAKERVILTSGLSKAYSMGGWRIGFAAITNELLYDGILKIIANTISSTSSITQDASVHAFKAWERVESMRKEFQERRNVMVNRLNSMGLPTFKPKGGFYIFPEVSKFFGKTIKGKEITSSKDVSLAFLNHAQIASVPGSAFGDDNHVRFSFVRPLDELNEACDSLEAFTNKYN